MPVLQQPSRRQHQRIGLVGQLVGRHEVGRHDLGPARLGRERVAENDLIAGLVRGVARIGDRVLPHQPLPGDVGERRHHLRHLAEHIRHVLVGPLQADALGDLLDQRPIQPRLARGADHGTADLHLPVGVGEGAPLLGVRRGWQDHVGVPGRLGEEQILHHQMLELGQRLARMLHVGI